MEKQENQQAQQAAQETPAHYSSMPSPDGQRQQAYDGLYETAKEQHVGRQVVSQGWWELRKVA